MKNTFDKSYAFVHEITILFIHSKLIESEFLSF